MDKYIKIYEDAIDEQSCEMLIKKFEKSTKDFQTVNMDLSLIHI